MSRGKVGFGGKLAIKVIRRYSLWERLKQFFTRKQP
jgi:hypothetical protein